MRMRRVHLTMCTKGITAFSNRYGVVVWTGKNDTKTISVDANLIRFQTEIFLKTEQNSSVFKKISVWKRIKCGQGLNNKTECPIFPYKRVSSKKILLPWFNKKMWLEYLFMKCVNCELTPHWTDCCFGEATLSWFFSALPKEIIRSPTAIWLLKRV